VVDQLLAAGHIVTAYVRNPAKLTTTHPNLTVIQGELDDPTGVAGAVDGADAVISALGPTLRRGATGAPISDGTRTIISAMKAAGVRRFMAWPPPASRTPATNPPSRARCCQSWPGWRFRTP
jgi:putative NADH-flavin reductase